MDFARFTRPMGRPKTSRSLTATRATGVVPIRRLAAWVCIIPRLLMLLQPGVQEERRASSILRALTQSSDFGFDLLALELLEVQAGL